jgi:hypothetical protein
VEIGAILPTTEIGKPPKAARSEPEASGVEDMAPQATQT